MATPVIVSAVRTPIATAFKGSLVHTSGEELAKTVVAAALERSRIDPAMVEDIILAESLYGGGAVARHAAVECGMNHAAGAAVNRHCAGSLTAIGFASASIIAGMEQAMIAGGVQSTSTGPQLRYRKLGTFDQFEDVLMPPTHPDTPDAPNKDMSITVGWNTAREMGLSREEMDAWALRSHQRAVAAIDDGLFADELVPVSARQTDNSFSIFASDEHPRRDTSIERLSSLKVIHPEIDGFSITPGNSSGINDAAAALTLLDEELARREGLEVLGRITAWASAAVEPARTGMAVIEVVNKLLRRAGIGVVDVDLWEINEAFASVPLAACRRFGISEDRMNIHGSGCSLGHPVAATGARMVTTLLHDLRRSGGGIGVAAMCAGGGQAGAVLIRV
ncbi:acetyl-CoA acetyltransferase [Tardibacter chloracetimidivorans]|uniref:Acetyl-CoA acetyltransferase n=1 Tax=Tardibacter chloracetimidivorans TaxID=1921510 RepID=A0A1L3ZW96_9SPHN|nr:thiolase family protein [Tardibacter chloracetimidivorans]API59904.1 acetyl-CoA acetyltransferase [Tardibacter chloracetimidivorans]